MLISLSSLDKGRIYRLMIQTIVPRPVAWILSDSGEGRLNLAPFSYFSGVTSEPPIISISIGRKPDGTKKDTWRNIEERHDFVVHIASPDQAAAVTGTAAGLDHGVSEIDVCGLATCRFELEGVRLPRLVGPKIAFACRLHHIVEVGAGPQGLVLGDVLGMWIDDSVATEDADGRVQVDAKALDPLGRLGGDDYGTLGEVITVARPR